MAESPWQRQADIIKDFVAIAARSINTAAECTETAAHDAGQSGLKREYTELQMVLEQLRMAGDALVLISERDLVAEMEK